MDVPRMKMAPIDFAVTWSKVKVKQLIYEKICPLDQYLLTPLPNLVQWMTLERR